MALWRAALTLTAVLWLVGCASTPGGSGAPAPTSPPPVDSTGRDGPPATPPPGLADLPDAEPRIETIRPGGANKPYEIAGQRYEPMAADVPYRERGLASWYGRKFHGRPTASGEPYDMYAMTAAHPTLPIPSYVKVRNPANGREIVVRVNDRGPFHGGRIIDLSYTAALKLDLLRGVAPVEVERLTHEAIRTGAWRPPGLAPATTSTTAVATAVAPSSAPAVFADLPPTSAAALPTAPAQNTVEASPAAVNVAATAAAAGIDRPAASANTAAPARGFWVQLGAFRQRAGADRLHQRLSVDLSWLAPVLAVFSDRDLLRVQAGPYADRAEATLVAQRVRASASLAAVVIERR